MKMINKDDLGSLTLRELDFVHDEIELVTGEKVEGWSRMGVEERAAAMRERFDGYLERKKAPVSEQEAWNRRKARYLKDRERHGCFVNKQAAAQQRGRIAAPLPEKLSRQVRRQLERKGIATPAESESYVPVLESDSGV